MYSTGNSSSQKPSPVMYLAARGRKESATGPFFGLEWLNGPSLAAALSVGSSADNWLA